MESEIAEPAVRVPVFRLGRFRLDALILLRGAGIRPDHRKKAVAAAAAPLGRRVPLRKRRAAFIRALDRGDQGRVHQHAALDDEAAHIELASARVMTRTRQRCEALPSLGAAGGAGGMPQRHTASFEGGFKPSRENQHREALTCLSNGRSG